MRHVLNLRSEKATIYAVAGGINIEAIVDFDENLSNISRWVISLRENEYIDDNPFTIAVINLIIEKLEKIKEVVNDRTKND